MRSARARIMKTFIYILMVMGLCVAPVVAQPRASGGHGIDEVSEYQDAALNYESAAGAQESIAEAILRNIKPDPSHEEDRDKQHRRKGRNASFKMQGINQLLGAAGNWDRAAKAWQSAASAVTEGSARQYFHEAANKCTNHATALIQRAAELAESAALVYTEVGNQQGHIRASQKAGQIRMQLARRQ